MSNHSANRVSIYLETLACADCGKHVVCIADSSGCGVRVNHHKCSGSWKLLDRIKLSGDEAKEMCEEVEHCIARVSAARDSA